MAAVRLVIACEAPPLAPLFAGEGHFPDIEVVVERVEPTERHHMMLQGAAFDVCEFSSINYLNGFDQGFPFTAIPVFPYRSFRHKDMWVSVQSGITQPADLAGKRMGLQLWANSAALWQRGALAHDYGLDLGAVEWVRNRPEEIESYTPPSWARIALRPPDQSFESMLVAGTLDAMMIPWEARFPAGSEGRTRRLFPDYAAVEQDWYARTGAFPIMHVMVIQNRVLDEHPWVAERLQVGLSAVLDRYVADQVAAGAPSFCWPSLSWAEQDRILGPQPWPSGLGANRATLELAVEYALEQGIITRRIDPAELFQYQGRALWGSE